MKIILDTYNSIEIKFQYSFLRQINGYDDALNSARKQAATAASGVDEVKTLLHALEAKTNETIANVSATSKKDDELKDQIAAINSTLAGKVEALQARIEQINVSTLCTGDDVDTTTIFRVVDGRRPMLPHITL